MEKKVTRRLHPISKRNNSLRELYEVPEDTRPLVRAPREPRKRKGLITFYLILSIAEAKEKSLLLLPACIVGI